MLSRFANKGPSSHGFPSGYVWMWDLDCEESWALKNWSFWTVVLENILESPLDCKEIKPKGNPKGNNPECSLEGLMPKLKFQYFAHLMWRTNLLEKTGEDWRQEEKGTTEDEMVGWHHRLNGHEFEQAPGDDEGQGSLACCSPWGHKESDATEWLNLSSKESACQCRRHGFDPWSGKIPHAAGQLSLCATTTEPVL